MRKPTSRGFSFSTSFPFSQKEARTGTKVIARTSEPSKAKEMVKAMGLNILPSMPWRVKRGRKTTMMMAIAKTTGLPTSAAARKIVWRVGCFP
ncbi:hypothetical protein D3C87_1165430 [compost metagenome]